TAVVTVSVTIDGVTCYTELSVSVRRGKVAASFYTPEKIAAARENAQKYKWARDMKNAAIETADKYLKYAESIYDIITSDGLPRSFYLCKKADPEPRYCRYCGCDVWNKYGRYGFKIDPLARAWKVQCPDCKRLFPSNDFESFYKLALNERGEFDRELGLKRHEEMFGGTYGYGYLKNDLYSELRETGKDPRTGDPITHGWGKLPKEPQNIADVWGVDDGFGYETGRTSPNGTGETHAYIAYYNFFGVWLNLQGYEGLVHTSLKAFRDAYIYTGDEKYGIAGAKLIDRIADFYPDYDTEKYYGPFFPSVSGFGDGKILGNTWDAAFFTEDIVDAYDVFFDLYDNPEIISYLSEKAKKYGLENDKGTGDAIRRNIEENFLVEIYEGVKRDQFAGNYGFKQDVVSKAAVVLDTQPTTQKMIDFVMQNGTRYMSTAKGEAWCTGGNVLAQVIDVVTRDGFGNESTMGYNTIWPENLLETAQNLNGYAEVNEEDNLLKNPKFIKMLKIYSPTRLAGRRRANIGDDGGTAVENGSMNNSLLLAGWQATKDPYFAQCLYLNAKGELSDLHYDIYTRDPESVQDEVKTVVETYGEYNESESSAATGYGFAALRDGMRFESTNASVINDTMRDWWMYFGTAVSHKHHDGMNLGIDAFGLNMAPDHGYPAEMTGEGAVTRTQWTAGTVSHNTVVVNDEPQTNGLKTADLLHFDDSGEVKVMDADGPTFYPMHTSTYRRTVVSVDVDDTVSYALDFFRIVGGDEHVYSFHSQSEKVEMSDDVTMVSQPMGTYAGADVPFGDTTRYKSDSGYNWLYNVERAKNPQTGTFMADFKVERLRPAMRSYAKKDWHLRLTMLNDFEVSEVALADGKAPTTKGNPEKFRYLLVRRSGEKLDTLFTTVLEPYIGQSAIESLERVEVTRADGKPMSPSEPVAAIKVRLNSGRCDYVIYAANNEVTYNIGELFEFCGFVGVYTLDGQGEVVRSYLMDGTKLGQTEAEYAALNGRVKGFTQGLPKGTVNEFTGATEYKSFIELELDEDYESLDCNSIIGNVINVKNDGVDNGSYIIESAEKNGRKLIVGVGDVSLIRSHKISGDRKGGYIYNIAEGQSARISLATYKTDAPIIESVADCSVSAGSSISIPITAKSDSGKELTLSGTVLPRGMSLNKESGMLTWKPDDSQVGDNHVAVTASDGDLASTVRFTITVYGRTTGTGTSTDKETSGDKEVTGNSGAAGSGGSGGGGGAAPSDKPDDTTNTDQTDTSDEKDDDESLLLEEKVPSGDEADEVEKPQFTDLGNHSWAADAINPLAAADIIRGTSETTFAPATNITRADFALLLVRAFNLTSDNAENFADVSASDYFATELAIARNTGIVNGIGDNKFAPRNHITRQDMMVIVYRALNSLPLEEKGDRRMAVDEVLPQYPDFTTVAPYAKEAVTALIGAGLVNGKNNLIAPTDYTTRAEVAVLIKRILDYVKK
ncbi:MAG: S-layer homology domain-containing protein, partial [Oscillospiraceae bacterium]|nr:S-layer homology domain-containing protein [Oscillospiraceae bacterium]